MRIRLEDPALADDLLRFLRERADCVAGRVGERELEASLLGSYHADAQRAELVRRLWQWSARRGQATVEVLSPSGDKRSVPSLYGSHPPGASPGAGAVATVARRMEVRINDPGWTDELVEALNGRDCVATRTGVDTLAVEFPWLERDDDARQAGIELAFFLRAWQARFPGVEAWVNLRFPHEPPPLQNSLS